MRPIQQDLRLLILAASAGSADGWSFFGLGHAFVANMTGNTVLLGIAVFQNPGDMLHPAISLGCYAFGAVLGSLLNPRLQPGEIWSRTVSRTLILEAILLIAAETGWIAVQRQAHHAPDLNWLLGTVALAIGLQSGAMVRLKIPGIVTTYITGTWTTMLSGLVRLLRGGDAASGERSQAEERLFLQAAVLATYFLSAVLTGWLFRHAPLAVGALPALSASLAALQGELRPREAKV